MLENIRLSLRGIWHHKLRSFLTMLGVIIGIASILAIVSIVEGTNRKIQKSLIGRGNNVVRIEARRNGIPWRYLGDPENPESYVPMGFPEVNAEMIETIERQDGVLHASVYHQADDTSDISAYYRSQRLGNISLYGVKDSYFNTISAKLLAGRVFSPEEEAGSEKLCLLDRRTAESVFGGSEGAIGKTIEINREPFRVIGVIDPDPDHADDYESESEYYQDLYNAGGGTNLFIPENAWPLIGYFDEPESIAVQVKETKQMKQIGEDTAALLNVNVTGSDAVYEAVTGQEGQDDLNTLTTAITAMLVSIASLSLLVGGIGVMNIMLVSVSERTAEIGLKKALGARPSAIRAQFLTEAAVLTGMGGLIGVVLGILLGRIIALFIGLEFAVSIPWIFIACGFSIGVGLLFGFLPARKAAKMNPIDALHRE